LEDHRGSVGGEDAVEGGGFKKRPLADYETRALGTRMARSELVQMTSATTCDCSVGLRSTSQIWEVTQVVSSSVSRFTVVLDQVKYLFHTWCSWSGEETHTATSLYILGPAVARKHSGCCPGLVPRPRNVTVLGTDACLMRRGRGQARNSWSRFPPLNVGGGPRPCPGFPLRCRPRPRSGPGAATVC
jgi:hypothetical protein